MTSTRTTGGPMLLGARLLRYAIGDVEDATTQDRVAERIGCERMTLYRWLNGHTIPSLEWAVRLEVLYGVSPRAWVEPDADQADTSSL